jgi:hypothetical protein
LGGRRAGADIRVHVAPYQLRARRDPSPLAENWRPVDQQGHELLNLGSLIHTWPPTNHTTPMLIALPEQHRSNFHRLRLLAKWIQESYQDPAHSRRAPHGHCLVRFYAAESGLKYLLSKALRIPHHHQLAFGNHTAESVEGFGHDILAMARRLTAPASSGLGFLAKTYRLTEGHKPDGAYQSFPVKQSHEAWRYGLVVNPTDQHELETGLLALIEWIAQEIGYT